MHRQIKHLSANACRELFLFDAQMKRPVAFLAAFALALLCPTTLVSVPLAFEHTPSSAESALSVINAGVSSSEDAPFARSDYQFLPGDFVYVTFQIAGFSVQAETRGEVRKIALHYQVTPVDNNNQALAPAESGDIETELSPEDKNWVPKRRSSFLLPSFVAAGTFHIHIAVKDSFAKAEVTQDIPFLIGGTKIRPASSITVENFRFGRKENDAEPLSVPAYSPGDTVYAHFEMAGFHLGPENKFHVAYGLTVFAPDGKPYIQALNAADIESKTAYPAGFIPGNLELKIGKESVRGEYIVLLTAHDLLGNEQSQIKQAFSVE